MKTRLFAVCALLLAFTSACKEPEKATNSTVTVTIGNDIPTTNYSATVTATVYGDGVTERGVCWGPDVNPTVNGLFKTEGNGPDQFQSKINGLTENTTYNVRAYAKVGTKVVYSSNKSFTTTKEATFDPSSTFIDDLNTAGLRYGLVRDAEGKFVMHYSINKATESITITYISNVGGKDATHQTEQLYINDSDDELTWLDVEKGSLAFSGIRRNGADFELMGSAGLVLAKSASATDIQAVYGALGTKYLFELKTPGAKPGGAPEGTVAPAYHNSVASVWNGTDLLEYNTEFCSIVAHSSSGYSARQYVSSIGSLPITEDVATFSFKTYTWLNGGTTAAEIAVQQEHATAVVPISTILENPNGVILVFDNGEKAVTDAGYFCWVISKTGTGWYQWWLNKNF